MLGWWYPWEHFAEANAKLLLKEALRTQAGGKAGLLKLNPVIRLSLHSGYWSSNIIPPRCLILPILKTNKRTNLPLISRLLLATTPFLCSLYTKFTGRVFGLFFFSFSVFTPPVLIRFSFPFIKNHFFERSIVTCMLSDPMVTSLSSFY